MTSKGKRGLYMILNILKKDLKRKKTMNIILLLFIVIATMFVASGLSNIITVIKGTEYFLDAAKIGDYVVITQRGDGGVPKILDNTKGVKGYRTENVIFGSNNNIKYKGEKVIAKNTIIIQTLNESKINLFNKDDEKLTEVDKGYIYVTGSFFDKNEIKYGEKITLEIQGVKKELVVKGKAKDALFGSTFLGNTRILMNEEDYKEICLAKGVENYFGNIFYIDSSDSEILEECLSDAHSVLFSGDRALVKMCYIMEMIIASVVVVLSICLMLVSFVILKFTITFTIGEEYREIGVMKAIGISDKKIRSIYVVKYFVLAVVGAIVGLNGSIPFGNVLMDSISKNMVLGNDIGFIINVLGALLVIVVIVSFAYLCTNKVKKASPVDAIKSGQTGERFKKKTVYRIGKSHMGTAGYMAVNDVISSPKRFVAIMISFFLCSVFTIGLVIVTETMKSKNLIDIFCQESDVYITDVNEVMKNMSIDGRDGLDKSMLELRKKLEAASMPAEVSIEAQFKYKVSFDGKAYNITCAQGINRLAKNYTYTKGTAPQNENEVAITEIISEKIGAKIGDVIEIDFGNAKKKCMITAYFQTMNQMGEVVRLHEDAKTNFKYIASLMAFQIDFTDNPGKKVIDERVEEIKELLDNDEVFSAAGYCADCIGVVDTMESVQYLLLVITIIVVILVTILLERMFISDELSQIALLKAIGFSNKKIIWWHVLRFCMVAVSVEILSVLLAKPITKLWCDPIFGMMGATNIEYYINPLKVFVIYPGIVFVVTIATATLSALYTNKVKSQDTSNIE